VVSRDREAENVYLAGEDENGLSDDSSDYVPPSEFLDEDIEDSPEVATNRRHQNSQSVRRPAGQTSRQAVQN